MAKVIEISPTSALGADDEEPLRVAAFGLVQTTRNRAAVLKCRSGIMPD